MIDFFYKDEDAFFEKIKDEAKSLNIDYKILMLDYFYKLKEIAKEKYRRLGISNTIFDDTMSDLEVWRNNCIKDYNVDGLEEFQWLKKHMKLKLFKLGRLQFEPISIKKNLIIDGTKINKGDIALEVHVQQGEKLDYFECKKSYEQAYKFFNGITNIFFCHSWLLCPELNKLLPKKSNILSFCQGYKIFYTDNSCTQAEERIFGKVESDKSLYKESTLLMRNAKQFLLEGNFLGCTSGIYLYL